MTPTPAAAEGATRAVAALGLSIPGAGRRNFGVHWLGFPAAGAKRSGDAGFVGLPGLALFER